MHGHMLQMFKGLDHSIENKGDSLVITVKGDKEDIAKLEKMLKAMKDLHEACGDDCCGEGCCH